jgi:hypothetical protein
MLPICWGLKILLHWLGKLGVKWAVMVGLVRIMPQEEPFACEPLVCCAPEEFINPECSGSSASSLVLQKVDDFCHCVGLSCDGFKGDLMELLAAIERIIARKSLLSNSKSAIGGKSELKRLSCSINYDSTGGSSSRSRVKRRGISIVL